MKTSDLRKFCKLAKEMGLKRLKTVDFEIEFIDYKVGVADQSPKMSANDSVFVPRTEELSDEDMLFYHSPIQFDNKPQDPSKAQPAV